MPIYEYKCKNCGHHFEVLQRISEEPLSACPECKKNTLKKICEDLLEESLTKCKDKKSDEKAPKKHADKKKKSEDKKSKDIT